MTDKTRIPIGTALRILCEVHTSNDDVVGFRIEMGATPQHRFVPERDYIAAWAAVREACCLPTRPERRQGHRRKEPVMILERDDGGARFGSFPWPGGRLIDDRRSPGSPDRRKP